MSTTLTVWMPTLSTRRPPSKRLDPGAILFVVFEDEEIFIRMLAPFPTQQRTC